MTVKKLVSPFCGPVNAVGVPCMKIIKIITVSFLLAYAPMCFASDYDQVFAGIASAGVVTSEGGVFANYNWVYMFFNAGVEIKKINDDSYADMHVGIGACELLQLQLGLGNEGASFKLRSDLRYRPAGRRHFERPYSQSILERIIITFGYEKYFSADVGELFLVGAGVWF